MRPSDKAGDPGSQFVPLWSDTHGGKTINPDNRYRTWPLVSSISAGTCRSAKSYLRRQLVEHVRGFESQLQGSCWHLFQTQFFLAEARPSAGDVSPRLLWQPIATVLVRNLRSRPPIQLRLLSAAPCGHNRTSLQDHDRYLTVQGSPRYAPAGQHGVKGKSMQESQTGMGGRDLAPDEAQEISEKMMAAMLSNSPEVVLELYADDCEVSDPAMELSGKEGLRRAVEYYFAAFKVQEFEAEQVICHGATLIIRSKHKVVHQGEYLGVPPSGESFTTWNVMWLIVRDGKIISDTSIWDAGELRRLESLAASR